MKQAYTRLAAALFLAASTQAYSQASATDSTIEEAIITASPHAKTAAEIAGSLSTLDGDALQREVGATLGETLKNQLGVHSSSFGPGVGIPVIRGQSGKRVEVLQNSTMVADVSDTSADHAVATEALLADRIEILRGPATLRYGSGAIGGVVNVIDNRIHTQRLEGIEGALESRYNTNSDERVIVGRLDAGSGNWGLHLDAVSRDSDLVDIPGFAAHEVEDPEDTSYGYIENSDSESESFAVGLSWVGDSVTSGFSISQLDSNYGVPPGGHAHHEEEGHEEEEHEEEEHGEEEHGEEEILTRIDMEQTLYQGKLLFTDLGENFDRLDIDLSYTEYAHRELEIEDSVAEVGTLFEVENTEIRAELVHNEIGNWLGAFGLQYSDRDFNANGEEAFVPQSNTQRMGIYLLEETELAGGSLELGARIDTQSLETAGLNSIDHDSFNFSASYLVQISQQQRFGFLLSHSERAPVAEELLAEGEHIATNTYEIGDASLDKEASFNAELTWALDGSDWSASAPSLFNRLSARASIYYNDFSNYIYEMDTGLRFSHDLEEEDGLTGLAACSNDIADFENDAEEFEEAVGCYLYVQEDATFTGVEAETTLAINARQGLRLWGDHVRAKLDQSGDVPRIPSSRIGASWDYSDQTWSAQISVTHALDQDQVGQGEETSEGYTRWDSYLGWNRDQLSVFVKGTNLTDEEIRNPTSFLREIAPEPGRGLTLGATYRF